MKKIAILATNGFEQSELEKPLEFLKKEGFETAIVSPEKTLKSWKGKDWGHELNADLLLKDARPEDFDALVLPGGVLNPDQLRINEKAIEFIGAFVDAGKPIAAICHGPWTLINAQAVDGIRMTSWPSLRMDLENAGATWVDEEVVVDGPFITSRNPDDIPAFNRAIKEMLLSEEKPVAYQRKVKPVEQAQRLI